MIQDITQAFVTMALFFLDLPVASVVQDYLKTTEGSEFKNSPIFDAVGRSKLRPARRTRTSNLFRPPTFWPKLEEIKRSRRPIFEIYPMDWAVLTRATIEKRIFTSPKHRVSQVLIPPVYRGGALSPAPFSPDDSICTGLTAAITEPGHSSPDMWIKYDGEGDYRAKFPPGYIDYTEWPDLLTQARPFAAANPTARFALLKLCRLATAFIDPVGRSWTWKFLPKDMPPSEWSIHNTVRLCLGTLRQSMLGGGPAPSEEPKPSKIKHKTWRDLQRVRDKKKWDNGERFKANEKWDYGHCELDERVFHRGDLVLVMGKDQEDLLRWCTAVTFALQTKPWFREVDLWKSFVNVDLEFVEGLDEFWLGNEVAEEEMPVSG
ncbi:hypothetical protein B0T14DRAFT_589176 [Immersiella caudata]|uniref:Uncharacterized protein n=1 Tax=Immersiella caudata TaxID=314043 RepID=A0AA39WKA4_9PEZI|nr:hypothetical protein B0T14DRAFT_589176 [Immersiella caudata]